MKEELLTLLKEGLPTFLDFDNAKAVFSFASQGLSPPQVRGVFPRGLEASYHLGQERILQSWLELVSYQCEVHIVPRFHSRPGNPPARLDWIRFVPTNLGPFLSGTLPLLADPERGLVGYGSLGRVVMRVPDILSYVEESLRENGFDPSTNPALPISVSSELVWKRLSKNMKGVIHNWMSKGPVFRPKDYVTKPSREGCRLTLADQVVIGLLYGFFDFGVKMKAISEPVELMNAPRGGAD